MKRWSEVATLHRPCLSEGAMSVGNPYPAAKALAKDASGLRAALLAADARLDVALTAQGVRHFGVPDACVAANGFTEDCYFLSGALMQDTKQPDKIHTNPVCGAISLAPVLDWVMQ